MYKPEASRFRYTGTGSAAYQLCVGGRGILTTIHDTAGQSRLILSRAPDLAGQDRLGLALEGHIRANPWSKCPGTTPRTCL